jgi:hypothetical protein
MGTENLYQVVPSLEKGASLPRSSRSRSDIEVWQKRNSSIVYRMKHSIAVYWLRAALFACAFFGLLVRSSPWREVEYPILNVDTNAPNQLLQDIVRAAGLARLC